MFEINHSHYKEALDRFADFFKVPFLLPDYVDKERHAVQSEWSMMQNQDGWAQRALSAQLLGAHPANQFYRKARARPKYVGNILLTQSQSYETQAVLVGKGYKLLKRDKSRQYKEPWLLVSSLPGSNGYAEKIAKCYSSRMQIEESFRDQKVIVTG